MHRKCRQLLRSMLVQQAETTKNDASDYVRHYFRPHLAKEGERPTLNIQDLSAIHGESVIEAYSFQDRCVEKLQEMKDVLIGWRVQGISDATRRSLVSRELYCGPIMNSMTKNLKEYRKVHSQGVPSISRDKLLDLEVQLAFRVEDGDIPELATTSEITDYLSDMYLVMELTACRSPWRPRDVPTHITDFSGGGYVVFSDPIPREKWVTRDLQALKVAILRNNSAVGLGKVSHISGTPMSAIKFLHRHLKSRSQDLQGKIVCTGCVGSIALEPGHYTAIFGTLGTTDCFVEQ